MAGAACLSTLAREETEPQATITIPPEMMMTFFRILQAIEFITEQNAIIESNEDDCDSNPFSHNTYHDQIN